MLQPKSITFDIGGGRMVSIETGKMARQADGSVVVKQGNCMLLATVVANKEPKDGQSFFPLSVDYQEKFASAGRVPGSFFKREARLNDYEILTSRLIDRALRPLFPEDYLCDVQVLISLISSDAEVMPDALACLAASAALAVSDIPIQEIISEVRIARKNGVFIINPSRTELADCDLEFIIAATDKNIMMVEGEAKECQEEDLVKAIELAHDAIRIQIKAQADLRDLVGITSKRDYKKPYRNEELNEKISAFAIDKMHAIASAASEKHQRSDAFKALHDEVVTFLGEELPDADKKLIGHYVGELQYYVVRDMILNDRKRLDGRGTEDVRPLEMETNILPTPHGSALFTRGETQSLTTVTFGTPLDELLVESANKSEYTKFILHYNFPPFSTGEVKMMRGVGRREVGHGALAMRSLKKMMPGSEYPYTVRVVSDILESNGSSSMATVCAGSLALMDAGVPLPKHVSGVAMGLIKKEDKFAVLTDILGDEDHLGDMDFKVAGTEDGITALQMDIKITGITTEIMQVALSQAKEGREHILAIMKKEMKGSRQELSTFAPRIITVKIHPDKIREVIGKGGSVIKALTEETGATIDIEDDGTIKIACVDSLQGEEAKRRILEITAEIEVGQIYEGTVIKMLDFGAIVSLLPGKDGLLHISQIAHQRVNAVTDFLSEGQKVKVQVIEVDDKGRVRVSAKALIEPPPAEEKVESKKED